MIELKKQCMDVLREVNQIWVDAIKAAERSESEGIDVTDISGKIIEKVVNLDQKFNEAMVRMSGPSAKKGIWGGKK